MLSATGGAHSGLNSYVMCDAYGITWGQRKAQSGATFVSWIKHDSYPHETSFVRHDEVVNQEFLSKQNRIEIINHSKSSTILNH